MKRFSIFALLVVMVALLVYSCDKRPTEYEKVLSKEPFAYVTFTGKIIIDGSLYDSQGKEITLPLTVPKLIGLKKILDDGYEFWVGGANLTLYTEISCISLTHPIN